MSTFPSRYSFDRLLLDPEKLSYNPTGDLIFPSVIATKGKLPNPLAAYYLYYAPHDAPGGICLATADHLEGPWIEYGKNPIVTRDWSPHYAVSHISSPHLIWVERVSRFYLYFHGENDTTRLATSADGIQFDYVGPVVTTAMYDRISESSYARVFPCQIPGRAAAFVMLFMGNNEGTRRIYAAWSQDGIHFTPQAKPVVNPPPGTEVTQVGAPWYVANEGRNFIVFHGDKTPPDLSGLSTDLYSVEVGPTFEDENHLGLFFSRHEVAPDNQRVSDPCFVEENGESWLFLSVGARLKQTIALARKVPSA